MKTIEVSESALESLKAMAQKLQEERDMLLAALKDMTERYASLVNSGDAGNWDPEDEDEVRQARFAIASCQESTKVMES